MKKVYVAHKYGGKLENKQEAERVIQYLIKKYRNTMFISPIHTFGFMYHDVSYERGMAWCLSLLDGCDELLLCDGWGSSRGCNMEHRFAKGNKPIYNGLDEFLEGYKESEVE